MEATLSMHFVIRGGLSIIIITTKLSHTCVHTVEVCVEMPSLSGVPRAAVQIMTKRTWEMLNFFLSRSIRMEELY